MGVGEHEVIETTDGGGKFGGESGEYVLIFGGVDGEDGDGIFNFHVEAL